MKKSESTPEQWAQYLQVVRTALKKRRAMLMAKGLCRDCGAFPSDAYPSTLCQSCKDDRFAREYKRRIRLAAGK